MKRLVIGKKLDVYEEQRGSSTIMISDVYIYMLRFITKRQEVEIRNN